MSKGFVNGTKGFVNGTKGFMPAIHKATLVLFFLIGCCGIFLLSAAYPQKQGVKVGIVSVMRKPPDLPTWISHHRAMGIAHFYLKIEDIDPCTLYYLEHERQKGDLYFEVDPSPDTGNQYNHIVDRQIEFCNRMFDRMLQGSLKRVDWVVHMDSDECLYGNLTVLSSMRSETPILKLENAEARYDHQRHARPPFAAQHFARCSRNEPCRAYANGKGIGAVLPGVRLIGAHDFAKDDIEPVLVPFEELHILHYDSPSFGIWSEKFLHMSKNVQLDGIPFDYYKESILAVRHAHNVYTRYTQQEQKENDQEFVYQSAKLPQRA
jgi:hypothetical protein